MRKVLLGMSGGIDSTVSAILLRQMGYDVVGLTLRVWSEDDRLENKQLPQYLTDAKNTAEKLQIPHHVADVREEFYDKVIQYFKNEYLTGRTPNPCAKCNVVLKWEVLQRFADHLNCEFMATGHYVQMEKVADFFYIKKGVDPDKEQSFFLWGLGQDILQRAIFPLGDLSKSKVREIALENGLELINKKKESTGICFLKGAYQPFLKQLIAADKKTVPQGNFLDENGAIIGKHQGYPYYTVGQRRGLGLVPKEPYYVKSICPDKNEIVLGNRESLVVKSMIVSHYHLINKADFNEPVITRIRYRKQAAWSRIEILDEYKLKVHFEQTEWSIAPGQTAAFYSGDRLLGGGYIYQ